MSRVYTGGTYDMFHIGHIQLLRAAKKIAGDDGEVIVALNTDEFIEEFKGSRPVLNYEHREAPLLACRYVDRVIPNVGGQDSRITIDSVLPIDFIVIGSDWAPPKDYYGQMMFDAQWLRERNITLLYVDRNTGMSTTEIKRRLKG